MRAMIYALIAMAGLSLSAPAMGHGYTIGSLTIDHPWAPPTDDLTEPGLAFFSIRNNGETDERLTGVLPLGGVANSAGLFTMVTAEGVQSVEPSEGGILIPAGETVYFSAEGAHVRLIELSEPLVEGEAELIKLQFGELGEINIVLAVYHNTEGGHHHHH